MPTYEHRYLHIVRNYHTERDLLAACVDLTHLNGYIRFGTDQFGAEPIIYDIYEFHDVNEYAIKHDLDWNNHPIRIDNFRFQQYKRNNSSSSRE